MGTDDHLRIDVVDANGKPLAPEANAIKFVHQCGVIVRDNVDISIQEWVKPAKLEGVTYVDDRTKDVLWTKLIAHFTLPVLDSEVKTKAMTAKVRHWALMKMAQQFNNYKNRLYREWDTKNKVPDFTGTRERQRPHWDAFLEYKKTELAQKRTKTNKDNAGKKIYHHKMGPGGYRVSEPKWDKLEADMRAKGIIPATEEWDRRIRNWLLAHGGEYDLETGQLVLDEKKVVHKTQEKIVNLIALSKEGKFIPDRERDELSEALGTKEKGGNTRGLGQVPWDQGFPEDRESYRSRARAKRRKEQEESDRLKSLEKKNEEILALYKEQQKQIDQMREGVPTLQLQQGSQDAPSQRRSSVASSIMVGDGETSYPVDYMTEKTSCELHVGVSNLSMKVAEGYALAADSTALWLGNVIPDGYARVGVDQVEPAYKSLNLDFPRADDETMLGDIVGGLILWPKKYIKFPGWEPRPPSSPPIHNSPIHNSPPDDDRDEHHDMSPSRSPPPHQPTPPPHQPTPSPPHQQTPPPPPPRHQTTPPPPTKARRQIRKSTISSSMGSRRSPLPKVPKSPPVRAYDRTEEESNAIAKSELVAHFAPKQPVEKEVYPPKAKSWATGFLTHPSQAEINRPDNYVRALRKTPSGGTASGKRNDVAQLGQQSNKSIDPLIVLPSGHGSATDLLPLTFRENFAAEAGITLSQLDNEELPLTGGQDYWKWEYGKSMVPPDQIRSLPTCLRDRKSTRLNSSHRSLSRMPSSA